MDGDKLVSYLIYDSYRIHIQDSKHLLEDLCHGKLGKASKLCTMLLQRAYTQPCYRTLKPEQFWRIVDKEAGSMVKLIPQRQSEIFQYNSKHRHLPLESILETNYVSAAVSFDVIYFSLSYIWSQKRSSLNAVKVHFLYLHFVFFYTLFKIAILSK